MQQQDGVRHDSQNPVDLPSDTGVAVVSIKKEEGTVRTARLLPEAEGRGQPVALVERNTRQTLHHSTALGMGVLNMVDIVWEITGVDGCLDMEVF